MKTENNTLPAFNHLTGKLQSQLYNEVCISLFRFEKRLRFSLICYDAFDIIIERDRWLLVDKTANDDKLIEWTHFERTTTDRIDSPVSCQVQLYVAGVALIMNDVLAELSMILSLKIYIDDDMPGKVIPFPTDNDYLQAY